MSDELEPSWRGLVAAIISRAIADARRPGWLLLWPADPRWIEALCDAIDLPASAVLGRLRVAERSVAHG